MDEIPSSEFRKQYARLIGQTLVTVNGHAIGLWTPMLGMSGTVEKSHTGPKGEKVIDRFTLNSVSVTAQQARDDLLKKINRGK